MKFLLLNSETEGAAHTINIGLNKLDIPDCPVLCLDSDCFYNIDIIKLWNGSNKIFVFNDNSNKEIYSYIKHDNNKIIDIKEKEKISQLACSGAYGFSSYKELLQYTNYILDNKIKYKNEYYTSNIIKQMIENSIVFDYKIINKKDWICLGTPIQVRLFCNNYPKININNNEKIKCKRYCFDLDGTICNTPLRPDDKKPGYLESTPFPFMVEQVNKLFDQGHYIIIMTARGRGSGIDWTDLTKEQLERWGIKYNELEPMFHKPHADIFIDDKGINVEAWKKTLPPKKGIIAGAFDLIHPGYIRMFKEAKEYCNHLTVALHEDPSWARPHKIKPVQSVEDRKEILRAIKYVDDIVVYYAEDTFLSYLKDYEVRFLGSDYLDGSYTGKDNPIDIVFLNRNHDYSTTELKRKIVESWGSR